MNLLHGLRQAEKTARNKAMSEAITTHYTFGCKLGIEGCDWNTQVQEFHIRVVQRDFKHGTFIEEYTYHIESNTYRNILALLEVSEEDWNAILNGLVQTYQLTVYDA